MRRVRLGLLLAEVGSKAGVEITQEEMTQALLARARAFPGREKEMWDFYRNNQQAFAELRAPIYEEKVVDHILGLAKVEDRKVSGRGAVEGRRGRKGRAGGGVAAGAAPEPWRRPGRRRRPSRRRRLGSGRRGRPP